MGLEVNDKVLAAYHLTRNLWDRYKKEKKLRGFSI